MASKTISLNTSVQPGTYLIGLNWEEVLLRTGHLHSHVIPSVSELAWVRHRDFTFPKQVCLLKHVNREYRVSVQTYSFAA